jgi:hypothetical protein
MSGARGNEPEGVKEALALLDFHFFPSDDESEKHLRADAFRENVIRLIVFDMHLAIEELLRSHVFDALSARSEVKSEHRISYVKGLASRQVLELAAQLGVIDSEVYGRLLALNALRNQAAHHWQLDEPITRRSGGASEQYPLTWEGQRLTPGIVKADFSTVYGEIYVALFESWLAAHPERPQTSE